MQPADTGNATDNVMDTSKVTITTNSYIQNDAVQSPVQSARALPRQILTGNQRGTLNITGSITVSNANNGQQVGMGSIPDGSGDFGFFSLDSNGNLIMKIVNGTIFTYNPADNYVNVMQSGLLPDGSGGLAVAKPGVSVDDAFTGS